jgi:hypothetical protein
MKKLIQLTLAAMVVFTPTVKGQITAGNLSNSYPNTFNDGGERAAVASFSFLHTIAGSNNTIVLVGCADNPWPSRTFQSVTYGGQAMSQLKDASGNPVALFLPTAGKAETTLYYLLNPPSGAQTVNVTMTNTVTNDHGPDCIAQDYQGVDQNTPIHEFYANNTLIGGANGTATCLFDTSVNGQVAVIFEYSTGYNFVASSASPFAAELLTGRYAAPQEGWTWTGPLAVGSYTESWTISSSSTSVNFSVVAVILNPYGTQPPPPPPTTAPSSPTVSASANTTISWSLVSGATNYNVYRATSSSGPFTVVGSGITGTQFTDTVAQGQSFVYKVTAANSAGESVMSAPVQVSVQ